jgi:hypothetical protein
VGHHGVVPASRPSNPPPAPRDPLEGVERLLVDGNNLLHALRRGSGGGPAAAIVGRLRAAVPATVAIEIVFDGPPEPGSSGRVASGVRVRYSGTRSADAVLISMVDVAGPPAPSTDPTILVCTDDTELRHVLRRRGAGTVGTGWLIRRLDRTRLAAPSVGAGRPRSPTHPTGPEEDEDARPGWRPGRGATTKTGNPRRTPRRDSRPPRPGC